MNDILQLQVGLGFVRFFLLLVLYDFVSLKNMITVTVVQ